jgi:hypothetical protein
MHDRSIADSGWWKARTAVVWPSNHHRSWDLTIWPGLGHPGGWRSTSGLIPTWRAIPVHAGGEWVSGHDVSGAGKQTLGRAMQSITTMMPTWQCGHARNDSPVSASNRSR